jgi:hemerythrin-like domain-containing protein
LLEYAALLEEHIHKEDEVLFPWLDQKLTAGDKEELMARFEKADSNLGLNVQKYHFFIETLEKQVR